MGQFDRRCPQGAKAKVFSAVFGTAEQLAEKVILGGNVEKRIASECPINDPQGSGDDFLSPDLSLFRLPIDFFSKL